MTIDRVVNKYKKKDTDPAELVANVEMDALRRKECLCLGYCDRANDTDAAGKPTPFASCPAAKAIYQVCVEYNMAMMITKCGATDKEGTPLYRPLGNLPL